jgi:polar amino acid transport system substrate-binding protein
MPLLLAVLLLVLAQPPQRAVLAPTGTLRASFIADNPVQGRVDSRTGTATGPAPDLVRELARRLGVPSEIRPLPNAGAVLESVRSGSVDIGFLAQEADRATQVDFSDAYSNSGAAYAVRSAAPFKTSADVDRAGIVVGSVAGQSPEVYLRATLRNARLESLAAVPTNAALGRMLIDGTFDAFGANRTRMEDLAREVSGLRVLPDDYMVTSQAIVVRKGDVARLAEVNRFLGDVRTSGFVKASLDRANVAGVSVAPEPKR